MFFVLTLLLFGLSCGITLAINVGLFAGSGLKFVIEVFYARINSIYAFIRGSLRHLSKFSVIFFAIYNISGNCLLLGDAEEDFENFFAEILL